MTAMIDMIDRLALHDIDTSFAALIEKPFFVKNIVNDFGAQSGKAFIDFIKQQHPNRYE
jgi:hypothetical protein